MIIDWQKLVINLVPSVIRKPILLALLDAFVKQVGDNYNILKSNNEKALLYASCTPQVIWLQYLLRQELNDSSISIVEGDGLPIDFVIYTELENTDRLKALLNRFKLAGKSYQMIAENIITNIRWSDSVCEKVFILWVVDSNGVVVDRLDFFNLAYVGSLDFPLYLNSATDDVAISGEKSWCQISLGILNDLMLEMSVDIDYMTGEPVNGIIYDETTIRFSADGKFVDLLITNSISNY